MRMPAGLVVVCSELVSGRWFKSGLSTTLTNNTRAMFRIWREEGFFRYPSLKKEPHGLAYLILNRAAPPTMSPSPSSLTLR